MNKHTLTVVLSLVFVIFTTACQPAAPDRNRDAARTASPAPTKEPIDRAAIEAEVLRVEKEWTETIKTRNVDAIKRNLADDVVLTYPDGTVGTKQSEMDDAARGAFSADSFELVESKVTILDADAAVLTGRTVMKNGKYKAPDGKTIDISGEYRFTDTFAKRNGTWQVVTSQATKIQNPTPSPAPAASPKASAPSVAPVPPKAASPAAKTTP